MGLCLSRCLRPPSNVYATTAPAHKRWWWFRHQTKHSEVHDDDDDPWRDDDPWCSDTPELRDYPYEPRAPSTVRTTPRPTLSVAPITRFLV